MWCVVCDVREWCLIFENVEVECGRHVLMAHKNEMKVWGVSQLLRAYNGAKMSPFAPIHFVAIHATLDVIMAKPNAPHCWWKGTSSSCLLVLTLAQSPCYGLHWPTSFGRVGWQPYNVPLIIRVVNLRHRCSMYHTMPCIIEELLYAWWNGIVHFVGSMWVAFNTGWHFQILLVKPHNFVPSKAQSLMLRRYAHV